MLLPRIVIKNFKPDLTHQAVNSDLDVIKQSTKKKSSRSPKFAVSPKSLVTSQTQLSEVFGRLSGKDFTKPTLWSQALVPPAAHLTESRVPLLPGIPL